MWFLVAIMSLLHEGDQRDLYIWTEPTFSSAEECLTYVQEYPDAVWLHLAEKFPNDKLSRLLCVDEEKLMDFMENADKAKGDPV